jgi:hypothetical protein
MTNMALHDITIDYFCNYMGGTVNPHVILVKSMGHKKIKKATELVKHQLVCNNCLDRLELNIISAQAHTFKINR